MAYAAEGKFILSENIEERIIKNFEKINDAFPGGVAFRFPRQGFSTNLFDIVATGIFHNLENLTPDDILQKCNQLQESQDLKNLTGAGSNTRKKLQGRIELGKRWFSV